MSIWPQIEMQLESNIDLCFVGGGFSDGTAVPSATTSASTYTLAHSFSSCTEACASHGMTCNADVMRAAIAQNPTNQEIKNWFHSAGMPCNGNVNRQYNGDSYPVLVANDGCYASSDPANNIHSCDAVPGSSSSSSNAKHRLCYCEGTRTPTDVFGAGLQDSGTFLQQRCMALRWCLSVIAASRQPRGPWGGSTPHPLSVRTWRLTLLSKLLLTMELDARSLGGVPGCATTTATPLHNVCTLSRALVLLTGCFHQTPLAGLNTNGGNQVVMAHQSPMSFLNGEFTFRATVVPTDLNPNYSVIPVLFTQNPVASSSQGKGFSLGSGFAQATTKLQVAFGDGLHQASHKFTFPSAPSAGNSLSVELHCEIIPVAGPPSSVAGPPASGAREGVVRRSGAVSRGAGPCCRAPQHREVWGSDAAVIVTNTLSSSSVPFIQTITADIDSDGHLDVLFGSALTRTVVWYKNDGSGSFSTSTSISDKMQELPSLGATDFANLASLEVGDIDLDGDPDLIMTTGDESVGYADRIALIPNLGTSGTGLWGYDAIWKNGYDHLGAVHAADLDGDGDLDLIYGRTDGANVIVLWNDCVRDPGTGVCNAWVHAAWQRLSQPTDAWSSGGSSILTSADMNGDLVADIVAASSENDLIVCWYGSSAPGAQVVYTTAAVVVSQAVVDGPRSISLVDIDGDNDLDVVSVGYYDDTLRWHENCGSDGFSSAYVHVISTVQKSSVAVATADMDSDGDVDVIATNPVDGLTTWFENNGAGVFTGPRHIDENGDDLGSVHVADLNGDAKLDVLAGLADKVAYYVPTLSRGRSCYGKASVAGTSIDLGTHSFAVPGDVYNHDGGVFGNNDGWEFEGSLEQLSICPRETSIAPTTSTPTAPTVAPTVSPTTSTPSGEYNSTILYSQGTPEQTCLLINLLTDMYKINVTALAGVSSLEWTFFHSDVCTEDACVLSMCGWAVGTYTIHGTIEFHASVNMST
ncbi:hypothetical protein CYMTET_28307, partial [Cymbomonas tetramitiformis]